MTRSPLSTLGILIAMAAWGARRIEQATFLATPNRTHRRSGQTAERYEEARRIHASLIRAYAGSPS